MTDRDAAIRAIESGQSVVVNGVQYTSKNVKDLPGIEAFVSGDPKSEAAAVEQLKKEKAELEKRLASLEASTKSAPKKEAAKEADSDNK